MFYVARVVIYIKNVKVITDRLLGRGLTEQRDNALAVLT
jgi:hypothetical protein